MIAMRILPLVIFVASIGFGNAAFSLLRIYPGSVPSSSPKVSNLMLMSRQDGRRSDTVPEIVPLKLSVPPNTAPVKRESVIRRVGLGSSITYVKSGENVKKVHSKDKNPSDKSNFIDPKESLLKSQFEFPEVLTEDVKANEIVKNENTVGQLGFNLLPKKSENVLESSGFSSVSIDGSASNSTTPASETTLSPQKPNYQTKIFTNENIKVLDKTSKKRGEIELKKADKKANEPAKLPNSPIFYIRIPPSPYNYIPGFGYVSTPAMDKNIVPVDFNANGKPSGLYFFQRPGDSTTSTTTPLPQTIENINWATTDNEAIENSISQTESVTDITELPTSKITLTTTTTKPPKIVMTNSKITYIKGNFPFNGRPSGVFSVHSPYKPDYFQILHSFFYPDRKKPVQKI